MNEKQILYQRLAEEQKHPFFLNPPQQRVFPLFQFTANKPSFSPVNTAMGPAVYSLLQASPPQANSPYSVSTSIDAAAAASNATSQTAGGSGLLNPVSVIGTGLGSPQRSAYPSQLYSSLLKYPFSPPTPSNMSGLSLLSPWNPAAAAAVNLQQLSTATSAVPTSVSQLPVFVAPSTPRNEHTENTSDDSSNTTTAQEPAQMRGLSGGALASNTLIGTSAASPWQPQNLHQQLAQSGTTPAAFQSSIPTPVAAAAAGGGGGLSHLIMSPRSNPASIQSPLSIFHPSPLSPMMLMQSPYSISSCPSVSSSSGCSSDGNNGPTKNYAQSEYHVGPRRPISEKMAEEDNQSEGGNNSGRNTPVNGDENSVVIPSTIDVANALNSRPARPATSSPSFPAPPPPPHPQSEMLKNPLSASQQVYSGLATHSQRVGGGATPGGLKQQQQQQQQQRGGRGRSPYPFSVESLSGGQPSSVGSTSHVSLLTKFTITLLSLAACTSFCMSRYIESASVPFSMYSVLVVL